jgi:hypothetical protein
VTARPVAELGGPAGAPGTDPTGVFRKLTIVIPAFNEELAIVRTLETLRSSVPEA